MSSYFTLLKSVSSDFFLPTFNGFMSSLPDALLFGSAIFAFMTQTFPMAILVLTVIELTIIHRLFGGFIGAVSGDNTHAEGQGCSASTPSLYSFNALGSILEQVAFPSGPIFLISGVMSYSIASLLNFRSELDELAKKDSEWKIRLPLAGAFSAAFLILFVVWRVAKGCDSVLASLGSSLFGVLVGGGLYLLHVYLFGRDSINFLGVPLLADRAAGGRPLYVCTSR